MSVPAIVVVVVRSRAIFIACCCYLKEKCQKRETLDDSVKQDHRCVAC